MQVKTREPETHWPRVLSVALTLTIAAGTGTSARAQGAITASAAAAVAMNKAQQVVEQARAAGNDLELGFGIQVESMIQNLQMAYRDSLNLTMDRLDESARKAFSDINDILETNRTKGFEEARKVMEQAQVAFDTIPFHNRIPLLTTYSPHFVEVTGNTFTVTVHGNFPFAFTSKDSPTLTVGGQTIRPSFCGTTRMTFNVPITLLGATPVGAIGSLPATLVIPWDASRWYDLFWTQVGQGVFPLEFAPLPASPGKLTVTHQVAGTRHETATRASEGFFFDSSTNDQEENRSLDLTPTEVSAGWRIVHGTPRFEPVNIIEGESGHDWWDKGYQGGSDTSIIWRARTERHHVGHSGKLVWRIVCQIARDVATVTNVAQDVPLTWGMSRVFGYPTGTWSATWTRFDGRQADLLATDAANAILQVNVTGDNLRVTTYTSR